MFTELWYLGIGGEYLKQVAPPTVTHWNTERTSPHSPVYNLSSLKSETRNWWGIGSVAFCTTQEIVASFSVDGMTSLIANIGATVRELSSRLDATLDENVTSEVGGDATQLRGGDEVSELSSHDVEPSSAFNDLLNNQTPSSLNSVSLAQQHNTFTVSVLCLAY